MIRKISIHSIQFYQKNISPYKGYSCAYRHYTGKDSCSEFTKKCILKYGVVKSIPLFKKQIERCKIVYYENQHNHSKPDGYEKFCNSCATIAPCI